jgi:hypothetical protein
MNEVAWCYLEGFGTKKDKVSSLPVTPHRMPSSNAQQRALLATGRHWHAHPIWKSFRMRALLPAGWMVLLVRPMVLLNPETVGQQRLCIPSPNDSPETPPSHTLLTPFCDLSHQADGLADTQWKQFAAAKYYRLAEKNGNKIIGNSW